MHYLATFVGQMIASKVVVDGVQIPDVQYKKFKPKMRELQAWADVFNGLKIEQPNTWVLTAQKLVDRVTSTKSDPPSRLGSSFDAFSSLMRQFEYTQMSKNWFLADMVYDAIEEAPEEIFWMDEQWICTKIMLPDGQFLFRRRKNHALTKRRLMEEQQKLGPISKEVEEGVEMIQALMGAEEAKPYTPKTGDLYIPSHSDDSDEKARFFRSVGKVLYHNQNTNRYSVDWDKQNRKFIVEPLKFPDRPYRGPAINYVTEWVQFMDAGLRRCVCLQGDPGTGKSTLARTAADEINRRTVKVTSTAFSNMYFSHWKLMCALLSPEVLILDDIDRIHNLAGYLDRFEDAYYDVPLTIFTSNDLDEIPDAFKRPGRIDQIIELQDPDPSVRLDILQAFAEMEGLGEIPEHRAAFMELLYTEYSGAYAVEYLRRVKILGWDYELPPDDMTFKKLVGKERELDPRQSEVDSEILDIYRERKSETSNGLLYEPVAHLQIEEES